MERYEVVMRLFVSEIQFDIKADFDASITSQPSSLLINYTPQPYPTFTTHTATVVFVGSIFRLYFSIS